MADAPYFVNGTSLYRLENDVSTITTIGTIVGSDRVSMADNGTQLMILVPNRTSYIYNRTTNTLAAITDTDFTANGNPLYVIYIDGYFMAITDEKKFIISNLNDGTAWDALDFGSAETDPDDISGIVNFNNQAYILGTETAEAQDNVGGSDFPFIRNGLFLDKGVDATFSVVKTSNAFMFIGSGANEDPAVWSFGPGGLRKISNTGVDIALADLTPNQMSQVGSYSYAQDGDTFVAWELPNETLVYGVETGLWHRRTSVVSIGSGYDHSRS
jgi:hypothetical protein